ncbi:MAG: DUF951 domain-containing protein [Acholeplasmataceae bacterium]
MKYSVGDTIVTKKKHVCGSNEWTVLRTGIEIKIRCKGCGREVMLFKAKLDKRIVRVKD